MLFRLTGNYSTAVSIAAFRSFMLKNQAVIRSVALVLEVSIFMIFLNLYVYVGDFLFSVFIYSHILLKALNIVAASGNR